MLNKLNKELYELEKKHVENQADYYEYLNKCVIGSPSVGAGRIKAQASLVYRVYQQTRAELNYLRREFTISSMEGEK